MRVLELELAVKEDLSAVEKGEILSAVVGKIRRCLEIPEATMIDVMISIAVCNMIDSARINVHATLESEGVEATLSLHPIEQRPLRNPFNAPKKK